VSAWFLCGLLVAWTVAQTGLAAFFALAHTLGRREGEYLLFGALCFALAVTTAGLALAYAADTDIAARVHAVRLVHAGAIAAAVLNLHFVIRYAGVNIGTWVVRALYGLGAVFELVNLTDVLWSSRTLYVVHSRVLGVEVSHARLSAGPLAYALWLLIVVEVFATPMLLGVAYRSGKREALSSLIGAMITALAAVNDIGLITGKVTSTVYLLPHGFMIYAFCVASTLLLRYRDTAGQLERTVKSLQERTVQLRQSHEELKLIQDELVKKQQLAAVGELAAAIAHEVRNPLAVIVNAVAGLRRARVSEDDRKMLLGIVDEETARLNRLVGDLLRFARPVNVKRATVSLIELARRTPQAASERHHIDVSVPDDPDLNTIHVDPALFRVVFDNLVDNACQAMPQGGVVRIHAVRDEIDGAPAVRIEITDSGKGMETEVLERATDPFFTTRPSGTGLGLPIVHRIVEAHGGDLVIDSELGVGTKVVLRIPIEPSGPRSGPHDSERSARSIPSATASGRTDSDPP
jgi:signal transduction histidine kinase